MDVVEACEKRLWLSSSQIAQKVAEKVEPQRFFTSKNGIKPSNACKEMSVAAIRLILERDNCAMLYYEVPVSIYRIPNVAIREQVNKLAIRQ